MVGSKQEGSVHSGIFEEEVIRGAQAHPPDREARDRLAHKYDKYFECYARHLVTLRDAREDRDWFARDLKQKTWESIFQNLHTFEPKKGCFKTWSTQILRNHWLKHVSRHPWGENAVSAEEDFRPNGEDQAGDERRHGKYVLSDGCPTEKAFFWRDLEEAYEAMTERLPVNYVAAIKLYCDHDKTTGEVAKILGISPKAAESRIRRSRAVLQQFLRDYRDGTWNHRPYAEKFF